MKIAMLATVAIGVIAGFTFVKSLPEIMRYLKMESM